MYARCQAVQKWGSYTTFPITSEKGDFSSDYSQMTAVWYVGTRWVDG